MIILITSGLEGVQYSMGNMQLRTMFFMAVLEVHLTRRGFHHGDVLLHIMATELWLN